MRFGVWAPVVPSLIVAASGMVHLMLQAFAPARSRWHAPLASLGYALALAASASYSSGLPRAAQLGGSISFDALALYGHAAILGIAILAVLLSPSYLRATCADRGEYYALLAFSVVGMLGMTLAADLIVLFVTLEILSVSLYALVGWRREQIESQEAALKYFVTGAFSSAVFLFGVAMLYGVAGTTSLRQLGRAVAEAPDDVARLAVVGAGLLLAGLAFKVGSAPFHMWTPDVYEGAPTPVTAFMAAAVKVAAFAAFLRVFFVALGDIVDEWQSAVGLLAVVTMIVGNLGALAQSNLKRLLAFSSVAHVGYLFTGLVGTAAVSGEAVLFYLVAYGSVTVASFGVVGALSAGSREIDTIDDLAGLGARRPLLAAAITVILISLTGVPVSAGFVGKFYLFRAAVASGWTILAIVGALTSVISAFYYLRIVVAMYMQPAAENADWPTLSLPVAGSLSACVAIAVGLGVYPAPVLDWARAAAMALR